MTIVKIFIVFLLIFPAMLADILLFLFGGWTREYDDYSLAYKLVGILE